MHYQVDEDPVDESRTTLIPSSAQIQQSPSLPTPPPIPSTLPGETLGTSNAGESVTSVEESNGTNTRSSDPLEEAISQVSLTVEASEGHTTAATAIAVDSGDLPHSSGAEQRSSTIAPVVNPSTAIRLEVGIEDCLHIQFEYDKPAYHLQVSLITSQLTCINRVHKLDGLSGTYPSTTSTSSPFYFIIVEFYEHFASRDFSRQCILICFLSNIYVYIFRFSHVMCHMSLGRILGRDSWTSALRTGSYQTQKYGINFAKEGNGRVWNSHVY